MTTNRIFLDLGSLLLVLFMTLSTEAQYFDPLTVDLFEQTGIEVHWANLSEDKAWYSGEIEDLNKLYEFGIPVDELSETDVKINILIGDRWELDIEIDTLGLELWYYPGYWEMFYKYDRINEDVKAKFDEICDLSDLTQEDDMFQLWNIINEDAFFIDTRMIMFGTAWPGIYKKFKYEYLDSIETGDDVTLLYLGDYQWKYIFPESGLEMKVVFTSGSFVKR